MYLNRMDIATIAGLLEKFPEVNLFEVTQDSSSGIGNITYVSFEREVNGVSGNFTVEISGVEDW